MQFAIDDVRRAAVGLLEQNHSSDVAERAVEPLLWAELAGISTQGLLKFSGTEPIQDMPVKGPVSIERDGPVSCVIDAGSNPATYVAQLATDAVIKKATQTGVALAAVRNFYSSNCALAFYMNRIAEAGFIGVMFSSSPTTVAPFGVADALFGTNPLAFGFPSLGDPVLFDAATSAMTWYGLVHSAAIGEPIPADVAIDDNGEPTTSAEAAMSGALLTFGDSAKAGGLNMAVQLMAGTLAGVPFSLQAGSEFGALVVAVDPTMFSDAGNFQTQCTAVVTAIKSAGKRPGVDEVRVPGERLFKTLRENQARGVIDVQDPIATILGLA